MAARYAPGQTEERIFRLLDDSPNSGRAIAAVLGLHPSSVQAALNILARRRMATHGTGGWTRGNESVKTASHQPRYAVTIWVSPQLRERYPDMPLSLMEAI